MLIGLFLIALLNLSAVLRFFFLCNRYTFVVECALIHIGEVKILQNEKIFVPSQKKITLYQF